MLKSPRDTYGETPLEHSRAMISLVETAASESSDSDSTGASVPRYKMDGNGRIIHNGFSDEKKGKSRKSTKQKMKSFLVWCGTLLIL